MREILFKAKRIDNGEWVEGYYLKAKNHWHKHKPHEDWITISTTQEEGGWRIIYSKYPIDANTICQYTGLTDKNRKKIWENDVVSCGGNLVVIWNERFASFCLGKNGWMYNHFFGEAIEGCDCEVIGNVFDNPELMGE